MQTTPLITHLSAVELARTIAAGDLSCREVVDAHIDRIEDVDDALNAVVIRRFDDARREADEADAARRRGDQLGLLHGVPVTIKDQFHVAGLPTTFGVSARANDIAAEDGPMVAAWRAAGAIILGKGNVPQTLAIPETDNALFGRTNNPWNLDRTPGGSSGGDAAIVAAGGAALGLAADLGGSLRIPAAWSGLATLNATARRLPIDYTPGRSAVGMEGVIALAGTLARSVADVAVATRVLAEAIIARPTSINPPVPWRDPSQVDVSGLRVALLPEVAGWAAGPAGRRALTEAADALRGQGAAVETWATPPDTQEGLDIVFRAWTADGMASIRDTLGSERPHPMLKRDLQMAGMPTRAIRALAAVMGWTGQERAAHLMRNVGTLSTAEFMDVLGDRIRYETTVMASLDAGGYDAVLCPAMPVPAPQHGTTPELADVWAAAAWFTLLGMPSGVVPVTRVRTGEESDRPASKDKILQAARHVEEGSAGLPVGVMVAARPWREDVSLAAMAAIEQGVRSHPGHPTTPPI